MTRVFNYFTAVARCALERGTICIFSQYSSHRSFDHLVPLSPSPSLSLSLSCSSLNDDFCFARTCCGFSRLWKLLSRDADSFRRSGNYLALDRTSASVVNYVDCFALILPFSFFLICVHCVLSGWIFFFLFSEIYSSYFCHIRQFPLIRSRHSEFWREKFHSDLTRQKKLVEIAKMIV